MGYLNYFANIRRNKAQIPSQSAKEAFYSFIYEK